jgi:hypothetical protein
MHGIVFCVVCSSVHLHVTLLPFISFHWGVSLSLSNSMMLERRGAV